MKERLFTGHIHTENELTVNPHNLEIGLCTGDTSSLAIWRSRHSNKQQGQRGGWGGWQWDCDTLETRSKIILGAVFAWGGFLVIQQCFGTNQTAHKDTLWAEQLISRVTEGTVQECTGSDGKKTFAGCAWGTFKIFMVTILLILLRGQSLLVCSWIFGFVLTFI